MSGVAAAPASTEGLPEQDDTLLLLFMCCHPALTRQSAIALTLRGVGGLTTAEIAHAYLVPEATMAQRISRAKQRIKSSGVPFGMPTERVIRPGDMLLLDYSVVIGGYRSDFTNTLVVGPRSAHGTTYVAARGRLYDAVSEVEAKLRYRSAAVGATVTVREGGFALELRRPVDAVAPGQVAVLYDGDAVVGAGVIERIAG